MKGRGTVPTRSPTAGPVRDAAAKTETHFLSPSHHELIRSTEVWLAGGTTWRAAEAGDTAKSGRGPPPGATGEGGSEQSSTGVPVEGVGSTPEGRASGTEPLNTGARAPAEMVAGWPANREATWRPRRAPDEGGRPAKGSVVAEPGSLAEVPTTVEPRGNEARGKTNLGFPPRVGC